MENHLIKALQNPSLYHHPIRSFRVIETHLSWILLTGFYAYKIKKTVNFGFVDFSSLEKRAYFCQEEIRLNQRLGGSLYLEVIPITGSIENPRLNGQGPPLEYAVKMREFPQNQLLSEILRNETLSFDLWRKLAIQIAEYHIQAFPAPKESVYGTPFTIKQPFLDNFKECYLILKDPALVKQLQNLEKHTLAEFENKISIFEMRKNQGYIRGCHGDLHTGNIILENNRFLIFDCIEFNAEFRWIDVINEIAFLIMDLEAQRKPPYAYYFLNQYLEITGDFSGLALLQFYISYRAMVRAKVVLLSQPSATLLNFQNYLSLSQQSFIQEKPRLIITMGVSGAGKTHLARELAAYLPAIHIRSDVERKRLFPGISKPTLYSDENTALTFKRLYTVAELILKSQYSVIVDAAFLRRKDREHFCSLAKALQVPFIILQCQAPDVILKDRIEKRLALKKDASDANLEVLKNQLKNQEPLLTTELSHALTLNTEESIEISILARHPIFGQ